MAIIVTCACGKQFKVKDELAGKKGKCTACGAVLSIPTVGVPAEAKKATDSRLPTDRQLPPAKAIPGAPAMQSGKATSGSAPLWIGMIAGGVCIVALAISLVVFGPWGRSSDNSVVEQQTSSTNANSPSQLPPDATPVSASDSDVESTSSIKATVLDWVKNTPAARSAFDRNARRMANAGEVAKAAHDWQEAIAAKGGPKRDVFETTMALMQYDAVWKDDKIQPALVERFAARIKAFPADELAKWQSTIKSTIDENIDPWNMATALVPEEDLFDGVVFKVDVSDRHLVRVKGIPKDAVFKFGSKVEGDPLFALLTLMQFDPLFENDRFRDDAFQDVLKVLDEFPKANPSKNTLVGCLGDSPERLAEYYGKAVAVTDSTDLKDTKVYTFKTDRFSIKAAVADGKCGDIQYMANRGTKLGPDVVDELLRANLPPGIQWQELQVGDTNANPKWMCEGKGNDGTEISRFAQRPSEELLIVVDLLFKQKYGLRDSATSERSGAKQDAAKSDLEKMQGNWSLVGMTIFGKSVPEDQVKQEGAGLVVTRDKYKVSGRNEGDTGTIKLDATKTPKAIDLSVDNGPRKGQTERAIYKFEGNRLLICRPGGAASARPTNFDAQVNANDPINSEMLLIYEHDN